jgi:hypothetical protein
MIEDVCAGNAMTQALFYQYQFPAGSSMILFFPV